METLAGTIIASLRQAWQNVRRPKVHDQQRNRCPRGVRVSPEKQFVGVVQKPEAVAESVVAAREADAAELVVADVAGADNSEFDNLMDWHSPEWEPFFLCYSFPPKERRCH
jgi:hypothetical protein